MNKKITFTAPGYPPLSQIEIAMLDQRLKQQGLEIVVLQPYPYRPTSSCDQCSQGYDCPAHKQWGKQ